MKKNLLIYIVVFFLIFIIEFGLNSYLSFNINEKEYLFYQNIINTVPLLTVLIGFGTPFSVVYLTSLSRNNNNIYLLESNLFVIYFSLFLCIIFLFLFKLEYLDLYILVALILSFFNAIKQNSVNFFLSKKELIKSSFIRLNQKLIYLLVVVFSTFIITLDNNIDFSYILILGELLGFIILVLKYKVVIINRFYKLKSIMIIAKYAFLTNFFSTISLAAPILLLNYFKYSVVEIISFSIAYTLFKYSGVLLGPLMQLITPRFTPIKNDKKRVHLLFKKYFIVISLSSIILSCIIYLFSDIFINLFFSSKYSESVSLFEIFIIGIPFMILSSYTSSIISSVVNVKYNFFISFVASIILVILVCYILIFHDISFLPFAILFHYLFLLVTTLCIYKYFYNRVVHVS